MLAGGSSREAHLEINETGMYDKIWRFRDGFKLFTPLDKIYVEIFWYVKYGINDDFGDGYGRVD